MEVTYSHCLGVHIGSRGGKTASVRHLDQLTDSQYTRILGTGLEYLECLKRYRCCQRVTVAGPTLMTVCAGPLRQPRSDVERDNTHLATWAEDLKTGRPLITVLPLSSLLLRA